LQDFAFHAENIKVIREILLKFLQLEILHLLFVATKVPKTLKVGLYATILDWKLSKNNFTNRSISELNTDALVWSAVKWVGWLGPRADINR